MDFFARAYLKDYVSKTEPILAKFFDQKIKEAAEISPINTEMMRRYKDFMKGGKKLRGALVKLGNECFNGKNEKAILQASIAMEIIQSFLLIHDDIMDQDELRRGKPTIHHQFETIHKQKYKKGDSSHYGICLGIVLGDTSFSLAIGILCASSLPDKVKIRALDLLNKILLNTTYGQALDVTYECFETITYEDVLRVHTHKTAYYTITGPLSIGAALAGAENNQIEKIKHFGQPIGIAFQIRDDILGMYSDEKTLGKPVDSDIREGKNTLLIVKALELANKKDKEFLQSHYGKTNLSKRNVEKIRKIIKDTGSLEYSNQLGWQLVQEGKSFIPEITTDPSLQKILASFADFMMERGS